MRSPGGGRPLNAVVSHQVMRTWELRTEDGRLYGFEIRNLVTGRRGVVRTIAKIPGAAVTQGLRYSERRYADFCHFTLCGAAFTVYEPFNDNSRFMLRADSEAGFDQVPRIKSIFDSTWWMGV